MRVIAQRRHLLGVEAKCLNRYGDPAQVDAATQRLKRLIRGHGNFIEYVPFTLIMMLLLEMGPSGLQPAPDAMAVSIIVHGIGLVLLVGMTHAHAYAFIVNPRNSPAGRTGGMAMTMTAVFSASLICLWQALGH